MYKVKILPDAEKYLKKLDRSAQLRLSEKINWLAENADIVIHHQLSSMPDDLKGLCKIKAGDYRILYWVYHSKQVITVYIIEHRKQIYQSLRRK